MKKVTFAASTSLLSSLGANAHLGHTRIFSLCNLSRLVDRGCHPHRGLSSTTRAPAAQARWRSSRTGSPLRSNSILLNLANWRLS